MGSILEVRHALVREPGDRYTGCISSHPLRHTVSLKRARAQHTAYCEALEELGLEVIRVPRDDERPDSCFVEDNAVVQGGKALICRMAKESRRGEEDGVEEVLRGVMPVWRAASPATVEGGDIIHLPGRLISGITQRTNEEGVVQMREFLGVPVDTIVDPSIVHLKSYVTYLGRGIMIAAERYAGHWALRGFEVVVVPEGEEYAADTLTIGGTVFMPSGLPRAHDAVRDLGFDVVPLEVGEFEKCEGAITCLSITF